MKSSTPKILWDIWDGALTDADFRIHRQWVGEYMIQFLNFVVLGIGIGALYGLISLPLSLVYTTTKVVDAAAGGYAVLGGMIAVAVGGFAGIVSGLAAATLAGAAMGFFFWTLERHGNQDHITAVLAGIGLIFAISAIVLWQFGPDPRFRPFLTSNWNIKGVSVSQQGALNLSVVVLVLAVSLFIIYRTSAGRIMRACASNPKDSQLVGIPIAQVQFLIFSLGGALCGVGGMLFVVTRGLSFGYGLPLTLAAFGGLIIFGLRGPGWAVAGGLTVGIVEGLSAGYLSSTISVIVPSAFILVALIINSAHVEIGERA